MDVSCFKVKNNIILYLFSMMILISCSETIVDIVNQESDGENIKIINTTIDLDLLSNILFAQLETNKAQSSELIKRASVEIVYLGDDILDANILDLYDDGTNGDIIPFNGIYTLSTYADTIILPNIIPQIQYIVIDSSFHIHTSAPSDTSNGLYIRVVILGKSFRIVSKIIDSLDNEILFTENINLDNSYIEIQINTDYMYLDNLETSECDRVFNDSPSEDAFESYFKLFNGRPIEDLNQFMFSTIIPFRSVKECGGTGTAYFRFVLHDEHTMSKIFSEDIPLMIYGCGDGICELGYEDENTCDRDCR
tara:strand:- start:651 stop:1574 length:924 start_codon:yes stop_codon:yes gene_type:complete